MAAMPKARLKFFGATGLTTFGSVANLERSGVSSKYTTWLAVSICRIEVAATCARASPPLAPAQRVAARTVFQMSSSVFCSLRAVLYLVVFFIFSPLMGFLFGLIDQAASPAHLPRIRSR